MHAHFVGGVAGALLASRGGKCGFLADGHGLLSLCWCGGCLLGWGKLKYLLNSLGSGGLSSRLLGGFAGSFSGSLS